MHIKMKMIKQETVHIFTFGTETINQSAIGQVNPMTKLKCKSFFTSNARRLSATDKF